MRGVQAVPHGLGQPGARIEEHAHPRQQVCAQLGVGLHGLGNHFKAGGHVEVHGGRDLAQVAQGLANQRACGLAVVDVERAAVHQREAEVVVAAEGVVPRQPVHQHGRGFGQHGQRQRDLLQVGAPHALGVDDRLGHLGGAAGEQELHDGARAGGVHGGIHRRRGRGGLQAVKRQGGTAFDAALGQHHFHIGAHGGFDGFAVARTVGRKHQPGGEGGDDVAQLVVVLAHGGVGGRHGAVGHPCVNAAQRQQRVLDGVLAQHHHRALGIQAPVQQGLADAAGGVQRLGVAHMLPVARLQWLARAQLLAPRQKAVVGRGLGPVHQVVRHAPGKGAQGQIGLQVAHARRAFAQVDPGDAEVHGPVAGSGGDCGHGSFVS